MNLTTIYILRKWI